MPRVNVTGLILLLGGIISGSARDGYVRTRDGSIQEGRVRFTSNAVVVVNLEREFIVHVPWTNVIQLGLTPLPPDRSPGPSSSDGALPRPWNSVDVGAVAEAGRVQPIAGGFNIRSAGTNIAGRSDSFHFISQPMHGDVQIIARVTGTGSRRPEVGLMMREGPGAEARQVSFFVGPNPVGRLLTREQPGAEASVWTEQPLRTPQWLKLTRVDQTFSAFYSPDNRRWHVLGRAHVPMPEELAIGIGATGSEGAMVATRVDQVRVGRSLGNNWFTPQVHLAGGSMQAGDILSIEDGLVRFANDSAIPVPTRAVSNIRFRPIPYRAARLLAHGQSGVFLPSGEFVAGEIRGLRSGELILSSIPLGLLRFDVGAEVMALVLHQAGPAERRPCRLLMSDGSIWRSASMSVIDDWVVLRDAVFGIRRVPLHEVTELQWSS